MLPSANWSDAGALETSASLPRLLGWTRRSCSCACGGIWCFSGHRGDTLSAVRVCWALRAGSCGTRLALVRSLETWLARGVQSCPSWFLCYAPLGLPIR